MASLLNSVVNKYLDFVYFQLQKSVSQPKLSQERVFSKLLSKFQKTLYGKEFGLDKYVNNSSDYRKAIPIVQYDDIKPYIKKMMAGNKNILIDGSTKYFSKSAGTTSDKSKFIPVPSQNLAKQHLKSAWNSLALFHQKRPETPLFAKKSLLIGGTIYSYEEHPQSIIGDISAVMATNIPTLARPFYAPDLDISLMPDWEKKLDRMAQILINDDIIMAGGVPTWLIVLFRKMLELSKKENMLEIWPNISAYFHGGVGFKPYFEQFRNFFPSDHMVYHEIYNASEGFFGAQDQLDQEGMLLFVNEEVYYEFLPSGTWEEKEPQTLLLHEVDLFTPYALIISSNNGLMRYAIGDVIEFTSSNPYRFKIIGRTKHYINTFGEELMADNTDQAIQNTSKALNALVYEYTVAPIYMSNTHKGGHEWIIEFLKPPHDINEFAALLDMKLREINSDYDAKRSFDLALNPLKLHSAPLGTFDNWMKSRKKLGGQHKVPRLANHRDFIDEIFKQYIAY